MSKVSLKLARISGVTIAILMGCSGSQVRHERSPASQPPDGEVVLLNCTPGNDPATFRCQWGYYWKNIKCIYTNNYCGSGDAKGIVTNIEDYCSAYQNKSSCEISVPPVYGFY
jgi:hypothetical protein